MQVLRGPVVRPDTVAGRQGMINEAESMLNGKPVYTIGAHRTKRESRRNVWHWLTSVISPLLAAFYTPWGAEGSLEVSAVTQQGNHEEARQRLTAIVASLESRS